MVRKWLFGGLTIVLMVALVSLIIQGNRLERQKASQRVEIIQEAEPSPIRVLAPKDIKLIQSKMRIEPASGKAKQTDIARHELEIRNTGSVRYEKIQLSFDYLGPKGKALATHTYAVDQTILPGTSLFLGDIVIDDVPHSAADCTVTVVFADIGHTAAQTD